jgi:hypothetical protein
MIWGGMAQLVDTCLVNERPWVQTPILPKKKKETDLGETYERNRVIRKGAKENTDNLVLK